MLSIYTGLMAQVLIYVCCNQALGNSADNSPLCVNQFPAAPCLGYNVMVPWMHQADGTAGAVWPVWPAWPGVCSAALLPMLTGHVVVVFFVVVVVVVDFLMSCKYHPYCEPAVSPSLSPVWRILARLDSFSLYLKVHG